jgi:hypothetical protein
MQSHCNSVCAVADSQYFAVCDVWFCISLVPSFSYAVRGTLVMKIVIVDCVHIWMGVLALWSLVTIMLFTSLLVEVFHLLSARSLHHHIW